MEPSITAPSTASESIAARLAVRFAWLKKGTLAILDQALFAGSNFLINILLARSLPRAQYGAFALAFSVLLLIGGIHSASITEPMMVFGPGKFADGYRKYLGILVYGHFGLTLPLGALLCAVGVEIGSTTNSPVGRALEACGIAVPLILFLRFARLGFYVKLKPAWSIAAGAIYCGLIVAVAWSLLRVKQLTPMNALIGMGASGFIVALVFLSRLRPTWQRKEGPDLSNVAKEHWKYGRWSVATDLSSWVPANIYYVVIPLWFGLAGSADLKALLNLMLPVQNCIAGLSMILMPSLVYDLRELGTKGMNRTMISHFSVLAGIACVYSSALWISGPFLLHLLYGGKYDALSRGLILLSGLLPLGAAAISIVGNGLRALERPNFIFWCYLAAAVVSVALGIPLTAFFGVVGALIGMCLTSLLASLMLLKSYRSLSLSARG